MRGRGWLELLGMPVTSRYFRMMTFQRDETLANLLTAEVCAQVEPSLDGRAFGDLADRAGGAGHLSRLQFIDFHHYLPGDILAKVDRASMLTSLESRVPLLDHVLIEFVATIPERLKLRAGVGKYILKRAMAGDLPGEVIARRKMGFGVPLGSWFRGELLEFVRELLLDRRVRQRGIVRPGAIEALFDLHTRHGRDVSAQLWSLICFELWCRTWLDR
jgi:asparagine synthase (glutamine-hydrolysing)